ncbi:MAG: hypothetical protein GX442_25480 [Candidatus Riflebacteria bacterium]|nr:hypothetical protein [Candidatus Riflebacteria bacterium]
MTFLGSLMAAYIEWVVCVLAGGLVASLLRPALSGAGTAIDLTFTLAVLLFLLRDTMSAGKRATGRWFIHGRPGDEPGPALGLSPGASFLRNLPLAVLFLGLTGVFVRALHIFHLVFFSVAGGVPLVVGFFAVKAAQGVGNRLAGVTVAGGPDFGRFVGVALVFGLVLVVASQADRFLYADFGGQGGTLGLPLSPSRNGVEESMGAYHRWYATGRVTVADLLRIASSRSLGITRIPALNGGVPSKIESFPAPAFPHPYQMTNHSALNKPMSWFWRFSFGLPQFMFGASVTIHADEDGTIVHIEDVD